MQRLKQSQVTFPKDLFWVHSGFSSWANFARPADSAGSGSVPVLDGDGVHKGQDQDLDESNYHFFWIGCR